MRLAIEILQLLVQSADSWLFEGSLAGLSDREWMALRFLARANRFSRTPTALASFLGTTRSVASQIAAVLESKGLMVRKPSAEDKRSIALCITSEGEKFLERDPINVLRDQLVTLELPDRSQLRDTLRRVLDGLDVAKRRHNADVCGRCMFLIESGEGKGRPLQVPAVPEIHSSKGHDPALRLFRGTRLGGTGAREDCCRAPCPHPEGPPTAGVSKDGHREVASKCDWPAPLGGYTWSAYTNLTDDWFGRTLFRWPRRPE
ncbi:MarR family winged helix-turn-helix transcriptional regulator [Bradyrhizobium sp. CCBAU 21360]|uniref:MarR family winged helix-turn-helix transcriptional regulator n=1 Tax=Bradyrhizobium sp. CCBAU 21360 TaxID=1325081 RepID=UPI0023066C48|nr:MarR family transcriptional regulator [Bradyrhizobium sp. CCBAU 21360]